MAYMKSFPISTYQLRLPLSPPLADLVPGSLPLPAPRAHARVAAPPRQPGLLGQAPVHLPALLPLHGPRPPRPLGAPWRTAGASEGGFSLRGPSGGRTSGLPIIRGISPVTPFAAGGVARGWARAGEALRETDARVPDSGRGGLRFRGPRPRWHATGTSDSTCTSKVLHDYTINLVCCIMSITLLCLQTSTASALRASD